MSSIIMANTQKDSKISKNNKTIKNNDVTKLGLFGFGVGYSWSACVKAVKKSIVLNHSFHLAVRSSLQISFIILSYTLFPHFRGYL
jgi:hypothetical protein